MLSRPLVSIITPAYNSQDFISETIRSVQEQTYPDWELLIIVDSKTIDQTLKITLDAQNKDARIKVFFGKDYSSISKNRNIGLKEAQGDYICFLDSDDVWFPNKLAIQIKYMLSNNFDITYHSFKINKEHGKSLSTSRTAKNILSYNDLLKNNEIGCSTIMIKKSLTLNKFMRDFPHEDYLYWLELMKNNIKAYPIKETLSQYNVRKGGASYNKMHAARWRWDIYKNMNMPLFKRLFYMSHYALTAITKRIY